MIWCLRWTEGFPRPTYASQSDRIQVVSALRSAPTDLLEAPKGCLSVALPLLGRAASKEKTATAAELPDLGLSLFAYARGD